MRHLLVCLMLAALCVLQVHASGIKWNRSFRNQGIASSPRLRQTTWKEINDRQVSRTNPNYRRQMASAVPFAFPTCSVVNPGTISVARYVQVELNGNDVSQRSISGCPSKALIYCITRQILSPGEFFAVSSEMECPRQCTLLSG
jgi:hypothetical protein